ncbi:winged helix DNA-binding domain-containing protein [Nocardioides sp. HDW12B]|uniref:winged helix DNA-binding domain-containing protein n=1 Tax=Nocardioides sp. HDW12B TaxID=2714939 RepID=UPI00197F858B|nr:winged helix DNA-binding domain-containing protein [Nocardioides sp. HDW12B]
MNTHGDLGLELAVEQRRARVVRRHRLDGSATSVAEAAGCVVALHATDPATVYLSTLVRAHALTLADVERELYDERAVVRLMGMRRTLFAAPTATVPVVQAAAASGVARAMRRTLVKQLGTLPTEPALPTDPAEVEVWLDETIALTEAAAARLGQASGAQLGAAEPRLRTAILPSTDKSYDVRRTVTSSVLTLMATEGRLVRSRPLGSWTSRQHTWEPLAPESEPWDEAAARAELVRRYLAAFGPATETDVVWWTGWAKGVTRAALARLDLAETSAGWVLADDTAPEPDVDPAAALLPALDPTPMGWKERDWFLPADRTALYDAYGNVGPTIWWGGEVVGGWAVRADGRVVTELLADRGRACADAVATAAAALEPRLEGARITPSFPTPLERRLRTA